MPNRALDIKKTLVAATSQQLLPENPLRTYALIQNVGATDVYLGMGIDAVQARGILLLANGGAYEITAINPWHGSIAAISAGTPGITVVEW